MGALIPDDFIKPIGSFLLLLREGKDHIYSDISDIKQGQRLLVSHQCKREIVVVEVRHKLQIQNVVSVRRVVNLI